MPETLPSSPLIHLHNVTKAYDIGEEQFFALKETSLEISQGEYVAIVGPSGSGKSTLMNILGCLDRPTSGEYLLAGRNVANLTRSELAETRNQLIGFVFQQFNLLHRTSAIENVELPLLYSGISAKERRGRAIKTLEHMGLASRMNHTPNQLSGGQQQRVAIARALVTEPRLLLADEPTGNLDSKTGQEVMDIFNELNTTGITVILVTHDNEVAAFAKRNIRVKDGAIQ